MDKIKPFQSVIIKLLFVLLCIAFLYLLIKWTIIYFYPFIIATAISFAIHPIVIFLKEKYKFNKLFATILIVSSLSLIFVGFIVVVLSELIQGTSYLADMVPNHFQTLINFMEQFIDDYIVSSYEKIISFLEILNIPTNITLSEYLHQITTNIASTGGNLLREFLLKTPVFLSIIPQSIAILIVILLATILITNELDKLKILSKNIVPRSSTAISRQILFHLGKAFSGFFKAQFILISINASIILIGLLFMRIEHALTIALLAAALDLLPLVGTGVVFIPWIFYTFITNNYPMTIGLSLLYMFIVILRQIIEPKILSVNVGISPLATLIILFFSFKFWGVGGIIIAPFLLIILSALYKAGVFEKVQRFIID